MKSSEFTREDFAAIGAVVVITALWICLCDRMLVLSSLIILAILVVAWTVNTYLEEAEREEVDRRFQLMKKEIAMGADPDSFGKLYGPGRLL